MARPHLFPLRVLTDSAGTGSQRAAVEIYRPFFLAGIITVLTAGCLLGAIALFGISNAGNYTASAWTPHILAHANSQLFGWVGFFVMGFALQQHAPSVKRSALFHRLAWSSLGLMAAGIAIRFAAEPLAAYNIPIGIPLGVTACLLQLCGVLLFLFNNFYTRYRPTPRQPLPWQSTFVFASLFWLLVIAAFEPFAFLGSHQADKVASIQFVAEWFAPMREAQFLGFVATMIFGVSLTKFHTCFGAPEADKSNGLMGFGWWTLGLLLRMGGWVWTFRHGMEGSSQAIYFTSGVCLTIGAAHVAYATRIFSRLEGSLPSHKFIRAAYGWLLVAGGLLVLEPSHLGSLGQPFSHAYTGAIRHAVTVGFISQMIVGVGSHVIARMNDVVLGRNNPRNRMKAIAFNLWPTFWLLNIGNSARVFCEIGTDYTPAAFRPMGITGFVELLGLILWAAPMVSIMFPRLLASRRRAVA